MADREHLIVTKLTTEYIEFDGPLFGDYLVAGTAIGTNQSFSPPSLNVVRDNLRLYQFSANDQGWFTVHMLHDIKEGTTPTFHCHWTHNEASPTGDVRWNVEYTTVRGYQQSAYPEARTISTIQTAGAQYFHHITPDDDMSLLSTDDIEPDTVLLGRIYRGGAGDTFNGDPFLIQIDLHYQLGQIGTKERNRPFPSAGYEQT